MVHSQFSKLAALLLAIAATAGVATDSFAQLAGKTITIVVAAPPGGPPDTLARMLAPRLEKVTSQTVVVENRPGAGTFIGNAYVAKSRPDGQTLLINTNGGLHSDVFMKDAPLVLVRELVPVAGIAEAPQFLVGALQTPGKDLKEFIAYARANPGKLNVALFPNTGQHLELASFLNRYGLKMTEVSFNSTPAVLTSMVRGEVHLYVSSAAGIKAMADEGRIRLLAVNSERRMPLFPAVPTTSELGLTMTLTSLFQLFGPASTPRDIVNGIYKNVSSAMNDAELWATLTKLGFIPLTRTPEELRALMLDENRRYKEVAASIGIKPE